MALSAQIHEITDLLATDLNAGGGARRTIDSAGAAFGWVGGLPLTVASYVEVASSTGLSVAVTTVKPSGTPAKKTAEGAAKAAATTITAGSVALDTFAGLSEFTVQRRLDATGLTGAVVSVLGAGCLTAFEADAETVILAGATSGGAAVATWMAALTAGQATVLANGGRPGLIIISAADYAAVVTELAGSAGFALSPDGGPIGQFFGSLLHVSTGMTAKTAVVADPAAILAVQHAETPIVTLDPYTKSDTNTIRVVADLVAKVTVVDATKVVKVSHT